MEGKPRPTAAATTPTRRSMKQQTLLSLNMNPQATPPRNAASPGSVAVLAAEESKRTTRAAAQLTPTRTSSSVATSAANGNNADTESVTSASPSRGRGRAVVTPLVATPRTPLLRPRRTPSAHAVGLRDPYEQHSLEALKEECARRGLSMQPRDQQQQSGKPVRITKTQFVELLQEADMLAMFERQSSSRRGSSSASSSASRKRTSRKVEMTPPAPLRVVAAAARPAAPVPTTVNTTTTTVKATVKPATTGGKAKRPAKKKATTAASLTAAASQTINEKATCVSLPNPPAIVRGAAPAFQNAPAETIELEGKRQAPVTAVTQSETVDLTEDEPMPTTVTAVGETAKQPAAKPSQAPANSVEPSVAAAPALEEKAKAADISVPTQQPSAAAAPTSKPSIAAAAAVAPSTTKPSTAAAAVSTVKTPSATASALAMTSSTASEPAAPATASTFRTAIRARRGCRFRLINVLMSPDFNTRWREMHVVPPTKGDVNAFWRDVHISFLCQNSFYGKVHFADALFDNVAPDVIQNHTAQKLQQMWSEIVMMYRRTWNQAKRSTEPKPFLDSCAGRLDLLYLHMGLLLEPELHKAVVNDAIPPRPRPPFVIVSNEAATVTMVGPAPTRAPINAVDDTAAVSTPSPAAAPAKKKAEAPRKPAASARLTDSVSGDEPELTTLSSSSSNGQAPRFVELKNPDMLPDWLLEDQAATAMERGLIPNTPAASSAASSTAKAKKPRPSRAKKTPVNATAAASPAGKSKASPSPVKTRDLVLHSSAINSIDDDSASSDYETTDQNTPAQSSQRRATGKRRREPAAAPAATTTDLVEVPTSRELVPHPHKRLHTTAVTTTLTRSQEMSVAPDEFDVMHHRLRKVNESIDQCYRTLGNSEAILNDMHREDVEADLRFYFGIKKRIQEQIVMFMHGF